MSIYERTESTRGVTSGGWLFPNQEKNTGTIEEPVMVPTGGLIATYSAGYDILPLTYDTWAASNPPAMMLEVLRPEYALLIVKATGTAAETGNLVFNFVGRCHETDPWPTKTNFTITLTLSGATTVVNVADYLVKGFAEIKLVNITTTCTTTLEGINCKISWKI
jgi:hypothetical protein